MWWLILMVGKSKFQNRDKITLYFLKNINYWEV